MPLYPDDGGDDVVVVVTPRRQRTPLRQDQRQPRYSVILWDSDGHTFDYVEKMLRELFGHQKEECQKIAKNVDADGKAVVLTTTKEHAELKRDQIHAYGKDNLEGSKGSMWSTIEAVE
jgi:ATP-dependent Clp protease adaptor protein ClpS